MALLILALLQRIFLMSSLMLLLVWLIFFMVLIKLLPILGTISGKTVKLMVLALICLGNRSEERFSRNAETDLVCRLLLEKKKNVMETDDMFLFINILNKAQTRCAVSMAELDRD